MIPNTRKTLLTAATTALVVLAGVSGAQAEPPVKLLVESQYGAKVNGTTGGSFCTFASSNACQAGEASSIPGGFGESSPDGVAVAPNGNVYVADADNQRVQEFTPTGQFVLMFGRDVNETTGGDVCTEAEIEVAVKCRLGVGSAESGGFKEPESLAVDPVNGNVYVEDFSNSRVQEFTATGEFVLMIGEQVNLTKDGAPGATEAEKNLCTAVSGNVCKAGLPAALGNTGHGAFYLPQGSSNDLVAGGPSDLLYVGDEHRVQEFKPDGTWVHDLLLTQISSAEFSKARAIALDQTSGDLYLVYNGAESSTQLLRTVFKFNASDKQVGEFVLRAREAGAQLQIQGMALDPSGRLAVVESEPEFTPPEHMVVASKWFGSLLDAETGKRITGFTVPRSGGGSGSMPSLAFNDGAVGAGEEMYGASENRHELIGYVPKVVAEPVTGPLLCKEAGEHETSVALNCEMTGMINPEGVEKTETSFLWNHSEEALDGPEAQETAKQQIADGSALVPVPAAPIADLRPNETIHYELAGYDALVQPPEPLTGEEVSTSTPIVTPKPLGEPSISFVKSASAVMFGELNPENAKTEFFFEYGAGEALKGCPHGVRQEACPGVARTATAESAAYGKTATTLEATGLQPATGYHYRLSAESENTAKTEHRGSLETPNPETEGEFTTAPGPVPGAQTGPVSRVGSTSATVSGAVNPDGQPAVYMFELGIYDGSLTQYGIVSSAAAGASTTPVEERLALSGLQPGTTYAYRIAISSSFVDNASHTLAGAPVTFTTAGLPAVLLVPTVLAQLPVPNIAFPKAMTTTTTTKTLTNAQKLAKALRACKKGSKKQRTVCQKQARRKYAKSKQANNRKKG